MSQECDYPNAVTISIHEDRRGNHVIHVRGGAGDTVVRWVSVNYPVAEEEIPRRAFSARGTLNAIEAALQEFATINGRRA